MGKNTSNQQMTNLIQGVINEQALAYQCEPGLCQCGPAFVPNTTIPMYTGQYALSDCQNADNCCMKWDCYIDGAGVCEAVNNSAASFLTENQCLAAYPNGCGRTDNDYDCNQSTGNVCGVYVGGAFPDMGSCMTAHPNGCARTDNDYDCNVDTGYQCGVSLGGAFPDMGSCMTAHPNGCQPVVDNEYDCIPNPSGGFMCIVTPGGPFAGPTAQSDCNAAVSNGTAPCNRVSSRAYDCDIENCKCTSNPGGSFTGPTALQDCNDALSNPNHECCCVDCDPIDPCEELMNDPNYEDCCQKCKNYSPGNPMPINDPCFVFCECCDPERFDCRRKQQQDGSFSVSCVASPTGQFTTLADCQAALIDPDSKCYDPGGDGGWECLEEGGCTDTGQGPYPDQATCEANSDDHYNIGGRCDCYCPGEPENCDSIDLISPVAVFNGEYSGMHGQVYEVGMYNLNLNDAKDKDGPLITSAFRKRMSPCGPSYRAPLGRVKHDCSFWKFIATKKLPNKYSQVITPASQGGLASANAENNWQMNHSTQVYSGGTLGGYPWHDWEPGPDGIQGTADDTPMIHAYTGLPINPYQGNQTGTAHPRWQRRIEAKIAYVRCLWNSCCGNTKWPGDGGQFTPYM